MLVIKPLWVAHVPQDATIYSGELRSKADVRSYTKKNDICKRICHFLQNILFLQRFCYIFRTLVLPFYFLHSNSTCLLGYWISFPALKIARVSSLDGKIVFLSIFFGRLTSSVYFGYF